MLGGVNGVGAVDDVAAELDAEVAADGSGLGGAAAVGRSGTFSERERCDERGRGGARCGERESDALSGEVNGKRTR